MPTAPSGKSLRRHAFLREFIKAPFKVGAIAPSGPHLARAMVGAIDPAGAQVIVEYGPGTGAFTDAIMPRLTPAMHYFAVELTPAFARILRERYPGAHVHNGSVVDIQKYCRAEGLPDHDAIDLIISGLPWASFSEELQRGILEPMRRVLKPGGRLITFGYHIGLMMKGGRRFYRMLPEYFASVHRGRLIKRNLPPAWVWTCTK